VVGGWIAAIVGYQTWALTRGMTPKDSVLRIVDVMRGSAWGPAIFFLAEALRPLLLLSAALLTIGAAFLYGVVGGLVLVVAATNTSALVAYSIGRLLKKGANMPAEASSPRVHQYFGRLRSHAFETIVTMRLLFLPYDLVSYVCGYLRVRPITFIGATALGSLPGTTTFVLFGASLERLTDTTPSIDWRLAAASGGLLIMTLAAARLLRRREATVSHG
jgi:uncharacterized membrane protein YdjX (TVP38/TMEM64 family)